MSKRHLLISSIATVVMTAGVLAASMVSASSPADAVSGGLSASSNWYLQSGNDCAEASASTILTAVTGKLVTEMSIVSTAMTVKRPNGQPAFLPQTGTYEDGIPSLFAAYGVKANLVTDASLDDLIAHLQTGHMVQAFVNSATIWTAVGITPNEGAQTTEPDHAVVVDSVNTTTGVVTLTDTSGQAVEMVPVTTFLTAWEGDMISVDA